MNSKQAAIIGMIGGVAIYSAIVGTAALLRVSDVREQVEQSGCCAPLVKADPRPYKVRPQ